MNHLREKWGARAKLSSSNMSDLASDTTPSSSSASNISSTLLTTAQANVKNRTRQSGQSVPTAVAALPPSEPPRRPMSTVETQRYETLSAWIKRSGITLSARDAAQRKGSVFDEIYDSLEDLEAAVKLELAQLLPMWMTTPAKQLPIPPRQSPIVDYMVVMGPDISDLESRLYWQGQENVYEASVVFAHPPQCQFNAECIEQFCFPDGVSVTQVGEHATEEDFFVLVLSGGGDQGQSVQYACCLRSHIRIPAVASENRVSGDGDSDLRFVAVCYAVVVSTPWIPFFHQFLHNLSERHQAELDNGKLQDTTSSSIVPDSLAQLVDSMMAALAEVPLPDRGELLQFSFPLLGSPSSPASTFECLRPRVDCGCPENIALLLDWAMPQLLSCLSIPRVILVISMLLVEMKVIVVSKSLPQLSAGTVGLAALLYPLAWAGPLISILPPSLYEYLEAPVPLLCGVEDLPSNFYLTKGTAVLLMEKDEIQLHPDDAAQLGALQFPGSEELSCQLCAFASPLKALNQPQTCVVVANVVMRRIRCQLRDLLVLCARVNPCNAHACMKQEQLSLSERLFLKSFMQSQMYQKYSDDLPRTHEDPATVERVDECHDSNDGALHPTTTTTTATPTTQPAPAASLKSSIQDLFLLAMTGSCASAIVAETSTATTAGNQTTNIVDDQADTEGYGGDDVIDDVFRNEPDPIEVRRPSVVSSKNSPPLNELKRESPRTRLDPELSESARLENVGQPERLHFLRAFGVNPDTMDTRQTTSPSPSQRERPAVTLPASLGNSPKTEPLHTFNSAPRHSSRSLPDMLHFSSQMPDDCASRVSIETSQQLLGVTKPVSPSSPAISSRGEDSRASSFQRVASDKRIIVSRAVRTLAAIKIQTAWRTWNQPPPPPLPRPTVAAEDLSHHKRPSFLRDTSASSIQSMSNDATTDGVLTELREGTTLSIVDDSGTRVTVSMRLSDDAMFLHWYRRHKLRGTILLADIQEIKSHGGNILIETTTNHSYTFAVPAHRSSQVIGFFQNLHRIATSQSATTSTSAPAVQQVATTTPPVSTAVRNESPRLERAAFTTVAAAKESSVQEPKRNILDQPRVPDDTGGGGSGLNGSSFLSFDDTMRRGVLILKHGRMGRPHPKYLTCDETFQLLSWTDPVVTNAGYVPQISSSVASHPHQQQAVARIDKKSIRFDEIVDVVRGKQTRVFQRSTAGRSNAELCFSIVTRARTLDIETFSLHEFALLYDSITQRMRRRAQTI